MATYYVDYVGGDDSNSGTSTSTPWQRCPGDGAATGNSASTTLQPGDTVYFKGGVTYPNGISVDEAGTEGNVITYDGNSAGTWGSGKAVMQGQWTVGTSGNNGHWRITNFSMPGGDRIEVRDGDGWRIDNVDFDGATNFVAVKVNPYHDNHPIGLVDNCTFNNSSVLVQGSAYQWTETGNTGAARQCARWYDEVDFGSVNYVYIEDCTFTKTAGSIWNAVDANYGGRYVFRYNTVTGHDFYLEAHSVQGNNRATRQWEIYENTITNNGPDATFSWTRLRGGTGVVFNNTIVGTWTHTSVLLDNIRSCRDIGGLPGKCDGTSDWDENTAGMNGWRCRDQIGAGRDATLWDGITGAGPAQADTPAYEWGNTAAGVDVDFNAPGGFETCDGPDYNTTHLVEGRDFYSDTEKPGYTSYTYPHPLQGESSADDAGAFFLIGVM